jgi:4-diphosphocytidyl-2-C-methyl-D-erythritol kinase
MMLCFPNAKINIGLNITDKRPDGFHNLETLFFPIGLKDIIEFSVPHKKPDQIITSFKNTGLTIDGKTCDNLIFRAYEILSNDYKLPAIDIFLHKIIPLGAGMGGGSSDAAFMLKALNEYFSLSINTIKLSEYAKTLGCDCAFFINNTPSFATEKGDKLIPIEIQLKGFHLLLIYPGFSVSTKEAYSLVMPNKPVLSLFDAIKKPVQQWKNLIKNDFETSVFQLYPELKKIKEQLYSLGAIYASMSGSGSAVYGIFSEKIKISEFSGYFVWDEEL